MVVIVIHKCVQFGLCVAFPEFLLLPLFAFDQLIFEAKRVFVFSVCEFFSEGGTLIEGGIFGAQSIFCGASSLFLLSRKTANQKNKKHHQE